MAAPAEKTLKDLNGQWTVNKSLSGSMDPALVIQGIGYLIRTGVSYATITINVNQYEAPPKPPHESADKFTHIDILQSASSLTSTQENRCLDDVDREHTDWLFGTVKGSSKWISLDEIEDPYLKNGWKLEGDGKLILSHVRSVDNGWTATQIWGFQEIDSERRYCRNIVVAKDDERAEIRLVFDYDDLDQEDLD